MDLSSLGSFSCLPDPWECLRASVYCDSVGVVVALSTPLADKGIPIFFISTHSGVCVLVQKGDLQPAIDTLATAGASMKNMDPLVL